jgi:anti-sigma factor RsiW
MSEHEQYDEDLALYALDALRGDDRTKLDQHLTTCAACRLELERLRADTALLAMSAMGPRPPQRARQRLLDAVAREARAPLAHAVARWPWWEWLGWAATAAVIVFALWLWQENAMLRATLASTSARQAESAR